MGNKATRSQSNIVPEPASNSVKADESGIDIGCFLPNEIIEIILLYLDDEPLAKCRLVCRLWNTLVKRTSLAKRNIGNWNFKLTKDEVLKYVKDNPEVHTLNLSPLKSNEIISDILYSTNPNLKRLFLSYKESLDGEKIYARFPRLTALGIVGCKFDSFQKVINKFEDLELLSMSTIKLHSLNLQLPRLKELIIELGTEYSFTKIGSNFYIDCPSLTSLDVFNSADRAGSMHVYKILESLHDLHSLRLINCAEEKPIIPLLIDRFPNLTYLDFAQGIQADAQSLTKLFSSCTKLRKVKLGLIYLKAATVLSHENLESLYLNNIEVKELELKTPKLTELSVICFHSLSKLTIAFFLKRLATLSVDSTVLQTFSLQVLRKLEFSCVHSIVKKNPYIRKFEWTDDCTARRKDIASLIPLMQNAISLSINMLDEEIVREIIKLSSESISLERLVINERLGVTVQLLEELLEKTKLWKIRLSSGMEGLEPLKKKYPTKFTSV